MAKYIVLGLFLLLMAGVAIYSRSRAGNTSDFMLAGRTVGPWMSAFAYGTSYFSAVIFIGYASDLGRQFGLSSMWVGIGNAILGCLFAWLVLAGPTRRITHALDASTMPQFLAKRFECPYLQSFSAVIIFLFLIPYSASVYQGINLLFTAAFGIDANVCYILIACLTALDVFFGGYFGAALADFFQGSIMIGGVCLLVYFVAAKGVSLTGSVSEALSQAAAYTPGSNGWDLVWLVLLTSLGALGMPHMIHKFYAIKDEGAIRKATYISTIFALLIGCGAYFCGAMGRVILGPEALDPNVNIMTTMLMDTSIIPEILMAIVLVLLLSASMSTLSALVLSASSSFSVDLVAKHIKTNREKRTHALLRGMCVLFIALSLAVTIFRIPIVDLMSYSWGIIAGAFLGPYIWGLFYPKTTREGAWAGLLLGAGGSLVMTILALAGIEGFVGHAPMIGVIGMLISLVAVPIVSLCTASKGHFGNLKGMKKQQ